MDKTKRTETIRAETRRLFLLNDLPEPLTRASRHLQIFDNYIAGTRLRLRSVRVPETKEWSWVLQQIESAAGSGTREIGEIHLNEAEHAAFEMFEGREIGKNERVATNEIRKNRYFYEHEGAAIAVDLFLGELWGLIIAQIAFEDAAAPEFAPPPFIAAEITGDEFYAGRNLLGVNFADVQRHYEGV